MGSIRPIVWVPCVIVLLISAFALGMSYAYSDCAADIRARLP